jgi:hypothetical protein
MSKCKMGNCSAKKEHKECCAECNELKGCEFVCWLSPGTNKIDCKKCVDYIEND